MPRIKSLPITVMCICPCTKHYIMKGTAFRKMTLHGGELHMKIVFVHSDAQLSVQTAWQIWNEFLEESLYSITCVNSTEPNKLHCFKCRRNRKILQVWRSNSIKVAQNLKYLLIKVVSIYVMKAYRETIGVPPLILIFGIVVRWISIFLFFFRFKVPCITYQY